MILTFDFESFAIAPRPEYPPKPVGIAIQIDNETQYYYAWGHPTNNNSIELEVIERFKFLLARCDKFICHNAMFDCSIVEEVWGIPIPWHKAECTMVMAFIDNPHGELALKPLTEELLGLPPEERDAVEVWLINHSVVRAGSKKWGAFIAYAPGDLVGVYACSDVDRTKRLYDYYLKKWELTPTRVTAYSEELRLMPHILKMDQQGVRIDVITLKKDLNAAYRELDRLDTEIGTILDADVDVDSNDDLANAIEAAGKSKGFATTATGRRSVAKDSLIAAIADNQLLGCLLVRNSLATCIRTFMQPWLEAAEKNPGNRLYIHWNQVRNYSDTGARTGRLSSSPNLQNVPTEWEKLLSQLEAIGYTPTTPMPQVRKYIIPDDGNILISRDFSGQEMRLLAHFAGGDLLARLQNEPEADVHMIAADIAGITRKVAKTLGFAVLYGAGVGRIAETLNCAIDEATRIKATYLEALPEIKALQADVQSRGRANRPIMTLGGRMYYVETAKFMEGRVRTFEYKLTNYLIQGSAADQTKQAMAWYCENTKHGRLLISVHDELVIECPVEYQDEESDLLNQAMTNAFGDTLDYHIISTEARGYNFGAL